MHHAYQIDLWGEEDANGFTDNPHSEYQLLMCSNRDCVEEDAPLLKIIFCVGSCVCCFACFHLASLHRPPGASAFSYVLRPLAWLMCGNERVDFRVQSLMCGYQNGPPL